MRIRRFFDTISSLVLLMALLLAPLSGVMARNDGERLRVGVALGGGGARGMAHVGVLRLLEELQVPIDCIAGTSMGSIIGGLYASGMSPAEMRETLSKINWPAIFTDGPPRADLPFRTKQEQRVLINASIGIKDGQAQLPRGLLEGQNLLLLLEELSLPAASIHDFNQLRIPYRAVATDLATGAPVVLGSGELAKAMRASMSIPSAVVPVELDGKLLVDGGVADNLPVDVVRALCKPDVVIAVDVGSPLAPASELTSLLSITGQLTTILTVRNTNEQIKTLKRSDVLITPQLKDIGSIDFDRSPEAVEIGYAAAEAQRAQLSKLAATPAAYQAYLAKLPKAPDSDAPVIDFIRIRNNTRLSDEVIEQQLHIRPGEQLDAQALNRNLNEIYGMGDFQRVSYTLVEEDGKTGLVVDAEQRDIGTNTLQFGLFLGANMKGDSEFNISTAYTMTQLNALGAEWRNFVQLGGNIVLASDFYQPLDADQDYFIDPYLLYEQYNLDLTNAAYAESSSFRVYQTKLGVEIGRNLQRWGRLSVNLYHGSGRNDLRLGQSSPYEGNFNNSGYALVWQADTLDNLDFPNSGSVGNLRFRQTLPAFGADQNTQLLSLDLAHAWTWGKYSLIPRLRLGGTLAGDPGIQDLFLQGGFLNLSGYQNGQLSGQYVALGELIYMYRLTNASAAFSIPIYAGGSLEAGGAWNEASEITFDSLIPAGSLFLGVDTPLGPFYLAGGYAEGGHMSLYMRLGRLF